MNGAPPGFKPKAPPGFKPKAPPPADKVRAGIIGGTQGLTAGFGEEIGAGIGQLFLPDESGVKPGAAAQPSPDDSPEIAEIKAKLNAPQPTDYEMIRDGMRKEAKAFADNPETSDIYNGAEMATGVASMFVPAAKGAGLFAKGARALSSPAALGAINAFGHAEGSAGEQALQTAGGAAFGKIADKGLGALSSRLKGGKFANWLQGKSTDASDEIFAAAQKSKDKAVESARGAMGGEAAGIIRSQQVAEEAAEKLAKIDPELAAELKAAAASPEALERFKAAASNYLPRLTEGLEKFAAKEADLAAAKLRDPAAEAATRGVKDVFLSDRSKKWYGGEALRKGAPVAGYLAGDVIGGEDDAGAKTLGAGAGVIASLMTGGRGSKVVNDIRSPEVRKALATGGEKTLGALGSFAEKLARPTALETTDDINSKYRALAEWLERSRAQ